LQLESYPQGRRNDERTDAKDSRVSANQKTARTWAPVDWIAIAAITLVAGALRLALLGDPASFVYDEYYYAREACWYLLHSVSLCGAIHVVVHPPLAKWLIALGIAAFGYNPLGWRAASVLAGTATVAIVYLLARRILRSTAGASLAAGLLAIDFLHFVHSRVAMLDVFVTLFSVATLLFCVYDRDRPTRTSSGGAASVFSHPWRIAAGGAAGTAMASKWPGAFALVAVLLLTIIWGLSARRSNGRGPVLLRTVREEGPSIGLWLVLLPVALYLASYAGTVSGNLLASPWADGSWLRAVGRQQVSMIHFHSVASRSDMAQSPPWFWILGKSPVIYFLAIGESTASAIVALGNPFVWWLSIPALAYAAARLIRSRDLRSAEAVIIIGFVCSYAPWFVLTHVRGLYLFHFLPAVPFLCLALGFAITMIPHPPRRVAVATAVALGSLIFFIYVHPVLVGTPRPQGSPGVFGSAMHNCEVYRNFVVPETLKPRSC
jgi:dolichyl-phosphate-mannose-protein mannosyltransferase